MSLSKVALNCGFCNVGKGIYSCPRCKRKYCSLYCYKCRDHGECSEAFYREWVEQTLQEKACDRTSKESMIQILKKFAVQVENEVPIEDRFAGLNIEDADESAIWQKLNEEERKKFNTFIEDEKNLETIVLVKQPWWINTELSLVTELDTNDPDMLDDIAARPPYPLNCKTLSELTSAKPSDCIQYNLVNILYSYAFLSRFYNCDLRDFLEDVITALFVLCPVLTAGRNYLSLQEALQDSVRVILDSDFNVPLAFAKSIVGDVSCIMHGPSNAKPSIFVLCALHDIKLLLYELKYLYRQRKDVEKALKKQLLFQIKKIEYFMSWSLEFESILSDIASDLLLIMLPDLIPDYHKEGESVVSNVKEKLIIEEIAQ